MNTKENTKKKKPRTPFKIAGARIFYTGHETGKHQYLGKTQFLEWRFLSEQSKKVRSKNINYFSF